MPDVFTWLDVAWKAAVAAVALLVTGIFIIMWRQAGDAKLKRDRGFKSPGPFFVFLLP